MSDSSSDSDNSNSDSEESSKYAPKSDDDGGGDDDAAAESAAAEARADEDLKAIAASLGAGRRADKENAPPAGDATKKRKRRSPKPKKRLAAAPPSKAFESPDERAVLCCLEGSITGKQGLEFKYGATLRGVWTYRREHLDTAHALKVEMDVHERDPGTFVCTGTFTDDPVLWGASKEREDHFVITVVGGGEQGHFTGTGQSFYGKYDVAGTLDRAENGHYARIRLIKLKKPFTCAPCHICGEVGDEAELVLCDGDENTCKVTAHASCLGLAIPDGNWYCDECKKPKCGPNCICKRAKPLVA